MRDAHPLWGGASSTELLQHTSWRAPGGPEGESSYAALLSWLSQHNLSAVGQYVNRSLPSRIFVVGFLALIQG